MVLEIPPVLPIEHHFSLILHDMYLPCFLFAGVICYPNRVTLLLRCKPFHPLCLLLWNQFLLYPFFLHFSLLRALQSLQKTFQLWNHRFLRVLAFQLSYILFSTDQCRPQNYTFTKPDNRFNLFLSNTYVMIGRPGIEIERTLITLFLRFCKGTKFSDSPISMSAFFVSYSSKLLKGPKSSLSLKKGLIFL